MRSTVAAATLAVLGACQAAPRIARPSPSQLWWFEIVDATPYAICEFETSQLPRGACLAAFLGRDVWIPDRLLLGRVERMGDLGLRHRAAFRLDVDERELRELCTRREATFTVYDASGFVWEPVIWFPLDVAAFVRATRPSARLEHGTKPRARQLARSAIVNDRCRRVVNGKLLLVRDGTDERGDGRNVAQPRR